MTDEFILDQIGKLLSCLRDCNISVRWLLLHRHSINSKVLWQEANDIQVPLLTLFINTAQFEQQLKTHFTRLFTTKQQKWSEYKVQCRGRIDELADYFSGQKELVRAGKNDNLRSWFENISRQIQELDHANSIAAGRKIAQLSLALEEVQEFHQVCFILSLLHRHKPHVL